MQGTRGRYTNIESEPRVRSAKQDFSILPFGEVPTEIGPGSLRRLGTLDNSIGVDYESSACQNVPDILRGLLDVAFNIHSETGSFRDRKTEIQGNATRNAAETDKETPQVIDVVENVGVIVQDGVFECRDENQTNQCSSFRTWVSK
jgi:hypothetical protein